MSKSRSKVHPKYKARYRVDNWPEYDRALVRRGDLTILFSSEVIASWKPPRTGRRGGQRLYSDIVIETALALRMLFGLAWRQTEGLFGSLLVLFGLDVQAPDHTTLSRRSQAITPTLRRTRVNGAVELVVDATGLSIVGQGQWAASKWGERGRRGWRKLHLAAGADGRILAVELTDSTVGDATIFPTLLGQVSEPIERVTADGGYDRRSVYEAAAARGARVIVPHRKGAVVSREPALSERDQHVEEIQRVGRRQWRVDVGQHRQARAENTFFRYKRAFGGRLRARNSEAQRNEVLVGANVLNRMAELGMPDSRRLIA